MEHEWERLGAELAGMWTPEGRIGGRGTAAEIGAALRAVTRLRGELSRHAEPPAAAEWLLDNWYLAQREGQEGIRSLKKARRLRAVQAGGHRVPYVAALCRVLAGTDHVLDAGGIAAFLTGVRSVCPLTEHELAHFFPALRGALVIRLEEAGHQLDTEGAARELERIFTSFRMLSAPGLWKLLEEASGVEQALRQDPAGIYEQMDDATRARYRRTLCALARRYGMAEGEAARRVLELAESGVGEERHVGWFLYRRPMGHPLRERQGGLYVAGVILPTLFVVLLMGFCLHSWIVALLLLLPVSDIVKNGLDFLVVRLVPPRPVHRLALKEGIPAEGKTLCVIAGLLTGEESGKEYAALLERYRLANRDAGAHLLLGLLADLPDSGTPMGGRARHWVKTARHAVGELNEKYGGGFYLFFREPAFQAVEERYQGWERKRGALLELCRLLRGRRTGLRVEAGERRELRGVQLVITLDSDTSLNVGTARELAGAMLHPLNRPVVDRRRNLVTEGYGVLQPRVGVELGAANKSQFSRIFAGQGGVDPYGGTCSDVYHDLFDQGTYTGKGIFDVDAFLLCLDGRFPENRILSHDLLEGSYLHAGLLGDVELTDSYPYKVSAYFSRLHRWVRGDWQLLPWLGGRVKNQSGRVELNPISPIAKWKIFDNLRRSLSPVCTLLALLLGMCFHGTDFGAAAGLAILAAASNLLLSGAELVWRGGAGLKARYHSTIIAGFGGVILQTLVQLLFLPFHAATCASAIVTSLWRQLVTRQGLLAWVTAADAERRAGDGVLANYRKQWAAVLIGLAAIVFSRFPAGAAAGLVWMLSPVFAWLLSRPIREVRTVPDAGRAFLLHEGSLIWRYFADFLRAEDHWLPPDNWQEQPPAGLARRTSPTNIGMALLCCLAAADLEYIPREKAVALISHTLTTVEALPKWHGHLYNWYDTASLAPLHPRYISTVDSGNLCGCLIALREGLYEWGEAGLARRAEVLSDAMEFSTLYDRDRRLFYIGYDLEKEAYTQGWYDLMASEARQTSYIAVARGEVEPRHWRRLGRMLTGDNDYSGMSSWTGTMFEYFMPNLLMPVEPNSLMYESLCFCVYEQRRMGQAQKVPWGTSESAFYAFDPGMHYQYKAHGVQRLGFRRGLDADLVIAPYASFLALPLAPESAGRNLRRLRDLGAEGRYGLYEALDYTPARLTGEGPFELVKSYMSHHLGMSLVAVDNALRDNIMVRRFMRDCAMGAYRELLQEKVPVGAAILKQPAPETQERPRRLSPGGFVREGNWDGLDRPPCHLVSNGAVSVLCTAAGTNRTRWGDLQLTGGEGIAFLLGTEEKVEELVPVRWHFDSGAAWTAKSGGVEAVISLRAPSGKDGVLWEIRLTGSREFHGELAWYLEPVLAADRDFQAHPAFSKLFLESAYTGDGVLFTRRPRRSEDSALALAVVWGAETVLFDTSREAAVGRGGRDALTTALRRPAQSTAGAVLDPCLLARMPLSLAAGESRTVRFALAAGEGGEEALEGARALLHGGRAGESSRLDRLIAAFHMSGQDALQAFELLAILEYPGRYPEIAQSQLWPYGVSGDDPIALVRPSSREEAEQALSWIGCHRLLAACSYAFDLVFLLDEGGDYRRPIRTFLAEQIRALHWDHHLGSHGGVHLIDVPAPALEEAAIPAGGPYPPFSKAQAKEKGKDFTLEPGIPLWENGPDGTFTIHAGPRLPLLGWSQILTNGSLGWMPDETGCGHFWLGNAREHLLTAWENDPLQIGGPEVLLLHTEEGERSLFADADGLSCDVTYGPGFARWTKTWRERRTVLTAFIPPDRDVRIWLVELKGQPAQIGYQNIGKVKTVYSIKEAISLVTGPDGAVTQGEVREARKLLNRTVMHWNRQVSSLKFHTPDSSLNSFLNGWALYQVLACRLLGRTSRYQSGGAYGFRDQLQDVCALLLTGSETTRTQILRACAHQFLEGDVQHWWHEPEQDAPGPGKGVRTRISDDLLWLPYAVCAYTERRGDDGLLDELCPYLESQPLSPEERERYEQPALSAQTGSVYEHACRAVERVLERGAGEHGLLLMGTGDWNDGMNLVGAAGRGESVWLTWFGIYVLERFAPLCEGRGDSARAAEFRTAAARLREAANASWDGGWFLRGWYDDGTPLGSRTCEECRIDSIAQSWAVLAGGDRGKAESAVCAALQQLWDREAGLVRLFAPAFDSGEQEPGYIKGYVPGVRENGGQYTHAAVWLALACLELGMAEDGWGILKTLLPAGRDPAVYKAEPYVLAADVYAAPAHRGRGGWSWYTGAAGWYYRTAVEHMLGLKLRAGRLLIEPVLPRDWPGYTAVWRTDQAVLRITVARGRQNRTLLDGRPVPSGADVAGLTGEHQLEVTLGPDGP